MKRCLTWMLMLVMTLSFSNALADQHELIQAFKLNNGLEIYVKPDHRSPIVASEIWYRVGSRYEHEGLTGISHALEHMMFKGTPTHPGKSFATVIAQAGGQQNASTADDYTYYYEILPKDKLALSFALEADRMHNLSLNAEDFVKEIEVVKEERRMRTDNNPAGQTFEMFRAMEFVSNPYHHPTIGWRHDLDALTITDLRNWYHQWYVPNQAIVVVVGDVEPNEVFQLAQKYFGHIPSSQDFTLKPQKEIQTFGERRLEVHLPAQVPWMLMGFSSPTIASSPQSLSNVLALDVLGDVLSGGDYARFKQNLVQKNRAASADIFYDSLASLSTAWVIDATPAKGQSLKQLEQSIWQEIINLQKNGVTQSELDLAKQQRQADEVYDQDSIINQAERIGRLAVNHLPMRWFDGYLQALNAVTPAQVQNAAKKYLQPQQATVAELIPIPHAAPIAQDNASMGALS